MGLTGGFRLSAPVTGATSGIGKAAAEQLARHGAEVIVHGRDRVRGEAVAGAISAECGKDRFIAADLPSLTNWPGRRRGSTCWSTTRGTRGSGRRRNST